MAIVDVATVVVGTTDFEALTAGGSDFFDITADEVAASLEAAIVVEVCTGLTACVDVVSSSTTVSVAFCVLPISVLVEIIS
jgi:hypothetical protein